MMAIHVQVVRHAFWCGDEQIVLEFVTLNCHIDTITRMVVCKCGQMWPQISNKNK